MIERIKKYIFAIPIYVVMILMVILPLFFSIIYMNKIKSHMFEYFTLLLVFIVVFFIILAIIETVYCFIDVNNRKKFSNNKKLIWYLLLFFLNIFIAPYYYYKYIKKGRKKEKIYTIYVITILILCSLSSITSIYSAILYDNYVNHLKEVEKQKSEVTTIVSSKENNFEMTFKVGFKKNDISDYDLYMKDEKRNIVTGAFLYDVTYFEEKNPKAVLDKQVEHIKNTRKNVEIYKEEINRKYGNKNITTIDLVGKTDESNDCIYKLTTISFDENDKNVVYIIQVVAKKDYSKYNKELVEIINSLNLK